MSSVFSSTELIEIAIDIEKRGISFYDVMAKSTDDDTARGAFFSLVEMERMHIDIFREMLDDAGNDLPGELQEPVNTDYIQALIDNAIFSDDLVTSELALAADTDVKALEIAVNAEKDSILFYYEMRDIMPSETITTINRIITEEKAHLQQLGDIKSRLTQP